MKHRFLSGSPWLWSSACRLPAFSRWPGLWAFGSSTFRPRPRSRPRWQFSLLSLFALTTAVAILLGLLELPHRPLDGGEYNRVDRPRLAAAWRSVPIVAFSLGLDIASLWAALGRRWAALAAAGSRSSGRGRILPLGPHTPGVRPPTAFFILLPAFLLGPLWVMRMAGYRWGRASRAQADEADSAAAG